jgi:nitronate monooxygenase
MKATDMQREWPAIIQGGMGIGVSNYRLARTVAESGCLGVVSGTAVDTVFVRRLQLGDANGDMRRALSHFPWPAVVERVLGEFFIEGGKLAGSAFRLLSLPAAEMSRARLEVLVLANFAEVWLAKEGGGVIGINYLE